MTPFARARPIDPGAVKVLVATFHTADTREPNISRERPVTDQTAVGMVAANDVEAVRTVASVCILMVVTALEIFAARLATIDDEALFKSATVFASTALAISVVEAPVYPIKKDWSRFDRSPPKAVPHVIVAGYMPWEVRVVVL